jgi:hypothetical protein
MIASRVHAVIAAGLENPQLLTLWRREPNQLLSYGVELAELDLNALWKFAGLTAKVRHNGLRTDLPLTFRLLNVAGLEIEVFASYASFAAAEGRRYADSPEERAQDLLSFLGHWLDFDKREHALLWDLIRYELALTRLSRTAAPISNLRSGEPLAQRQPRAQSLPRVCGEIILREMSCDPRLVGAKLQEKSPRLEEVSIGTFHFCYWRRDAIAEIHILQIDELAFYLLSFADGKRSAANLSRLLGGSRRPSKGFLKALAGLAAVGIIAFDTTADKTQ